MVFSVEQAMMSRFAEDISICHKTRRLSESSATRAGAARTRLDQHRLACHRMQKPAVEKLSIQDWHERGAMSLDLFLDKPKTVG
jgi:hypothetical protein